MDELHVESVRDVCDSLGWTLIVNPHKPFHAIARVLGRTGHMITNPDAMLHLVEGFIVAVKASGRILMRPKRLDSRWLVCDAYGRIGDGPVYQIVLNPDFRRKTITIKTILRVKRGKIPDVVVETLSISDDDYYDHRAIALGDFLLEADAATFARDVRRRDRRNGGDSAAPVEGV